MPGLLRYIRDNFQRVALINLGFLMLFALTVLLPPLFGRFAGPPARALLAWAVCAYFARTAALLGGGAVTENNAAFTGLVMFILCLPPYFLLSRAIPFFLLLGGWTGVAAATACFWLAAVCAAIIQFYAALRARANQPPLKAFKTCCVLFAAHPSAALTALAAALALSLPVVTIPALPLVYLDRVMRRLYIPRAA